MYIIKNGRVHIGNGTILEHCDILIRGSKIEKVAENIIEPAAEIIEPGTWIRTKFISR